MAARTLIRRRLASEIAVRARTNPDDPALPALRQRADALHVAEILEWAQYAATVLPPLSTADITAVRREVYAINARLREREQAAS